FEVSTDKVDSEVPSPVSGTLLEIKVPEGETVDVGAVLAIMGDGDAAPAEAPAAEAPAEEAPAAEAPAEPAPAPEAPAPAPAQPAPTPAPAPAAPAGEGSGGGRVLSPVVRRLLNEYGLDPATITGTGVGGRITRNDVLSAAEALGRSGGGAAPAAAP